MEWHFLLIFWFGSLIVLMASGLPVAFCFLLLNVAGVWLLMGGTSGLEQLIWSIFESVTTFTILPVAVFILMGEVMFHSGISTHLVEAVDKWLGRLPGRLGLLAVGSGTLLATLTGVSMASVAMVGSVLVPQMEERGYKKAMTIGPVLGCGAIAIMIPPSALAVLLGAIGEISIGRILIAIIVPGLVMAVFYSLYIIIRCWLQPSLAPPYDVPPTSLSDKLLSTARYILPIGFIIFLVIGFILLGIATPTEAAASGALGAIILAAINGRLDWTLLRKSFYGTISVSIMIYMILVGSAGFTQLIAYSGATRGLIALAMGLPVADMVIIIGMLIIVLILGCFMAVPPVMMITLPIFVPIVEAMEFNLVWFSVVYLICAELGAISPPFGLSLFVMKGVAPPGTTMGDVYRGALPFIAMDLLVVVLVLAVPMVALWLPSLM